LATWLWKGKEPLFFCSKIRNEVDKKLFQARVTSLEQLLSTVWIGTNTSWYLSQILF
ncbi:IS5/IS1182 family transposase, partial [Enterococcus faecium]